MVEKRPKYEQMAVWISDKVTQPRHRKGDKWLSKNRCPKSRQVQFSDIYCIVYTSIAGNRMISGALSDSIKTRFKQFLLKGAVHKWRHQWTSFIGWGQINNYRSDVPSGGECLLGLTNSLCSNFNWKKNNFCWRIKLNGITLLMLICRCFQ